MTGSISIHVVSDFLKRKFIQPKTQGRLIQNASTFKLKLRCTENSCQFENLFLTKLTG